MMTMITIFGFWACTAKHNPTPSIQAEPQHKPEVVENNSVAPQVILDGVTVHVDWDDGDTFSFVDTNTNKKVKARLNGFNTLESYGPVHQWGDWTPQELFQIAKDAGEFARKQVWVCSDTQRGGGYGRILVDCPELRIAILRAGLAHPFSVDRPAPETDLIALQTAIENKSGMWKKGAPQKVITSLHSQDEKPDKDAYNRICDLTIGQCNVETHTDVYTTCQRVCLYDSCMIYVPYKQRYGEQRASCLR